MGDPASFRMFYDASCGPCTFWARFTAGVSQVGVDAYPLDGPEADLELGSMAPELRYGYFHIVEPGRILTGPDAMPAWIGLLGGKPARALAERASPVKHLLRLGYNRFWEYRRSRGCAADRSTPG
jgi:predicted DCC family thiol-disulfide oxidoreductase YuxK